MLSCSLSALFPRRPFARMRGLNVCRTLYENRDV